MVEITHQVIMDCSNMTSIECSDAVLVALEHSPSFALKADTPTDTVHGSVTIAHNDPPQAHDIRVEIYDQDEPPTGSRMSTLKRPAIVPPASAIRNRLDTLKVGR